MNLVKTATETPAKLGVSDLLKQLTKSGKVFWLYGLAVVAAQPRRIDAEIMAEAAAVSQLGSSGAGP